MTTPTAPTFPVDDTTLDMLWTALHPGPEAERSSVNDLLELFSDMHFGPLGESVELDGEVVELAGCRWHQHDVISALITEVRRLRAAP